MWGAKTSSGGIILASWSQVERIVKRSDLVLLVLDSREPLNTFSERLVKLIRKHGKNLLLVLNKYDLIPPSIAEKWIKYFGKQGYSIVVTSILVDKSIKKLKQAIRKNAKSYPIVVSITGYPKVGKSSLINAIKSKHSASTSPYPGSPGYTKHFQLYRVDRDILVIDTPGILPVEGDPLTRILRGYPIEKLKDPVNPAIMLIKRILENNQSAFEKVYGIDSREPLEILEKLARQRGWFYRKTGEPLIEEAARCIIRDYHNGKLVYYISPPIDIDNEGREN